MVLERVAELRAQPRLALEVACAAVTVTLHVVVGALFRIMTTFVFSCCAFAQRCGRCRAAMHCTVCNCCRRDVRSCSAALQTSR